MKVPACGKLNSGIAGAGDEDEDEGGTVVLCCCCGPPDEGGTVVLCCRVGPLTAPPKKGLLLPSSGVGGTGPVGGGPGGARWGGVTGNGFNFFGGRDCETFKWLEPSIGCERMYVCTTPSAGVDLSACPGCGYEKSTLILEMPGVPGWTYQRDCLNVENDQEDGKDEDDT